MNFKEGVKVETITFIIDKKIKRLFQKLALSRKTTISEMIRQSVYGLVMRKYNANDYKRGPK